MPLTEYGFIISGREIIEIIFIVSIGITILKMFGGVIRGVRFESIRSDDYPGYNQYTNDELDKKRRKKEFQMFYLDMMKKLECCPLEISVTKKTYFRLKLI